MKPGTKLALSAAMRKSQTQASESPAPAHTPFTAAITGFSSARIASTFGWYESRSASPTSRRLAELLQILPGREAAAGAGQDDGAHLRVARLLQCLAQRRVQRAVERVQHVGAVQRDRLNCAVARDLDLGHARTLPGAAAASGASAA